MNKQTVVYKRLSYFCPKNSNKIGYPILSADLAQGVNWNQKIRIKRA